LQSEVQRHGGGAAAFLVKATVALALAVTVSCSDESPSPAGAGSGGASGHDGGANPDPGTGGTGAGGVLGLGTGGFVLAGTGGTGTGGTLDRDGSTDLPGGTGGAGTGGMSGSGGRGSGGADGGATFACGSDRCTVGDSYCQTDPTFGGGGAPASAYHCLGFGSACARKDCSCVAACASHNMICLETEGAVTITCYPP